MKQSEVIALVSFVVVLVAGGGNASAHALGAECKLRGDLVVVEAYFSDNTAAQDAHVRVSDGASKTVADGTTDAAGRWSFPIPAAGHYHVIVDAGLGHRVSVSLTIDAKNGAPATADDSKIVSAGPTRSEWTETPWVGILCGLALIGLASAGLRWWLRRKVRGAYQPRNDGTKPIAAEDLKTGSI